MPKINEEQAHEIRNYISWFKYVMSEKYRSIFDNLPLARDLAEFAEIYGYLNKIDEDIERQLLEGITKQPPEVLLDDSLLPCIKRIVLTSRRKQAKDIEREKEKTHHSDIIHKLEERLSPLDELLKQPWLRGVEPIRMPRLVDFLSIELITKGSNYYLKLPNREYDEKFHVLQSPRLFLDDMSYYRAICAMRGTAVIVAYLDIDDFKINFNSNYGETEVDRRVLPRFMQALEAHVFGHGFAYRKGGDEYILFLYNMSYDLALHFLDLIRCDVAKLEYRGIKEHTTISIGFCYVDADCYLTDREAEERANKAKDYAKQHGKNRIATYRGINFADSSLHIVSPV
jgi:diguanylate cyclase (GGDEF)-like protein